MKMLAFSVYDAAAEAYLPPTFMSTKAMAIRIFRDAINEEGHQFGRHAADYTLFHVGFFDQITGKLEVIEPNSLGCAVVYLETESVQLFKEAP